MQITNLKINLNQQCKVKLNEKAVKHLQCQYDKINNLYDNNINLKIEFDKDGYYHTQLHTLMRDFGDMICGCYSPFENCEVILDKVWDNVQI